MGTGGYGFTGYAGNARLRITIGRTEYGASVFLEGHGTGIPEGAYKAAYHFHDQTDADRCAFRFAHENGIKQAIGGYPLEKPQGFCYHDLAELAAMRDGNRDGNCTDESLIKALKKDGVCDTCIRSTFLLSPEELKAHLDEKEAAA